MEASRFGFGRLPPAFKFDPTDDDIVAHYLLPRALGVPDPPFSHAVINADPASLPPPDLLALHGHANSHHAFFLDVSKNGGRREREIKGGAGGLWRGQQGNYRTITLLRPGGGELDIVYKRYDLTYKRFDEEDDEEEDSKGKKRKRKNEGPPSGWIMHEYTIISPPLRNTVLSRIKLTKNKINDDQPQADVHQHHQVVPATEQPGPSYYRDNLPYQEQAGPSHRHYFPYQEQAGPSHRHDFPYQELPGPSHRHDFPYQEQPGPSYHQDFPYQEQPGPSHHQDFPYQEQAGPSHRHDFPYQQEQPGPSHHHDFPYQQQAGPGRSYEHHPTDIMCHGGGEGFSDGSQADDASCYGDNGSAMGDGFVNMLNAGERFAGDNTYYHNPVDMLCVRGEGFSDGSQADDASFFGDYGGGIAGGFVNMLCSGEGFDGDNTYHHQPLDMTCGGGHGFSDGSQADDASDNGGGMGDGYINLPYAGTTPTTATTCTTTTNTMTSTCQVATTTNQADDQDKF